MSTLHLTLPQSMHEQVEALAQKEGISINAFITLAVALKLRHAGHGRLSRREREAWQPRKALSRAGKSPRC